MIFSCRYCRPKKRQNPSCIILCIFAFLPLSFSHERERHYFSSIRHKQLSCLAQKRGGSMSYLAQYSIESMDFLPNMVSSSWRVTENQPGDWSEIETAKYFERCIICGTGDVPLRPVSNSFKTYKGFVKMLVKMPWPGLATIKDFLNEHVVPDIRNQTLRTIVMPNIPVTAGKILYLR